MKSFDVSAFYASNSVLPFKDRWAVMPLQASLPVPPQELELQWSILQNSDLSGKKRLIYIHIPFCDIHCQFCGFYQNPLKKFDTKTYIDYLLQEISLEINNKAMQSAPIHAIYFGGGTPSALAAGQLARVISYFKQHAPLAPDCEITVEGRISDFDQDKIDSYIEAGANRFSIGIQTFNTAIRQRLGRQSSEKEIIEGFERIAARDSVALVCDLMFGLPNQTPATWQRDLEIAEQLPLDGVDLYSLNLLPTTPLAKGVENNRIAIPSVTDKCNFYHQGAEYLAKQGWTHLTNAHWAKTSRERNLYNFLIKQGSHFFAFGSCAGGKLDGQSFMIHRDLSQYYALLDQGKKPLMMLTGKPLVGDWLHKLQAGIEKGRVDLTQLTNQAELFDPLIKQWHAVGLLQNEDHCLRLTLSGRFWSSNIVQALQQLLLQLNNPEHIELQQKMAQARQAMQQGNGMPKSHPHMQNIQVKTKN
ncbi:heme anaerobic degradation radical SAM methyltransferase ChuW/HutW [Gilliamella apicola]|uniref:Heme anaerobic degradation radical SAM methyltransferase ChuW/HutW n=1 Tax=Gilliamella apicola TaxID=1196095 RepID=A0A2V4E0C7_9GAMM|nr:heme anaerobic degradation radical SAM methyltransferase ChuW/HutW [Gilliamella apicola]PXZ04306.1 heme anaerobic degradation radical SAM methyltransferase ChuW/HutW [Gilliamella apicola]